MTAPRLAIWKLASCDGCQLTLLDCEDELLELAEVVNIAHFPEATSATSPGPYDISLLEGSVSTAADMDRVREIRAQSSVLVAIGACATAGGIQALRNLGDLDEVKEVVYARPEQIEVLATSTAASDHVTVDYELHGCPVDRRQLLDLLTALLHGRKPDLPGHSVCFECKRQGTVCVTVATGTTCLGPVTRAGCGALCPAYGRGCFGCFGPAVMANTSALADALSRHGESPADIARSFRMFAGGAPAFSAEGRRHDAPAR